MENETHTPGTATKLHTEARETLTLGIASLVFLALTFAFAPLIVVQVGITVWGLAKGAFVVGAREASRPDRRRTQIGMVLALTSLLMVVLILPDLWLHARHTRRQARQSISIHNVHQLSIALQAYAMDNNGRFPGWVRMPDRRLTHNVWDEQINPKLKSKDAFSNGERGIRSYSDPLRQRTVTYGLNGLLITPAKSFDGTADWSKPAPRTLDDISNPAGTILFAELATEKPMAGEYGQPQMPLFATAKANPSEQWKSAVVGWIDIDPRPFVETTGAGSYDERTWDDTRGVARDLYGGGACYAFVDGHVRFMKLSRTVGADMGVPVKKYWTTYNQNNMWNPDR